MSNPTSNFGWQMPTSSDLVTDLPADFEVFGQAVDTSMADLKGGTTGQVLKKNSNTDMDFVWSADSAGMTNPMTTTGDTIYSSSGSTPARLGIGSTGQVLTVAGGVPTWASASAAATSYTLLNAGGTALTGATTITVSGLSGYNKLFVFATGVSATGAADFNIKLNSDAGNNYNYTGNWLGWTSPLSGNNSSQSGGSQINAGKLGAATDVGSVSVYIDAANSTGIKPFQSIGSGAGTGGELWSRNGYYSGASVISSVSIGSNSGNFDAGTIYVYGAN